MKINVTEILPGDELQLADGSMKRAAGAWSAGPLAPVEVRWTDKSEIGVFPRETTVTVVSRLHAAVPSEEDEQRLREAIAHHTACIMALPGKEAPLLARSTERGQGRDAFAGPAGDRGGSP